MAAAAAALGTPLPDPPKDGITSLQYWAESPLLLVSSWDEVRVGRVAGRAVRVRELHASVPQLLPPLFIGRAL